MFSVIDQEKLNEFMSDGWSYIDHSNIGSSEPVVQI